MATAAEGLAQMGVGIGILTKTKVANDQYLKSLLGYRVLVLKVASPHQGGIGLIWRENHDGFEVEAVGPLTLNLMSFQLVRGNERFYVMWIYIPPYFTTGVEDLRVAWEACPADCTPLVVGDLNIWFEDSPNNRADALSTCWRRSTPPISPTIFSLKDAASSGDGHAGPSACRGGGVVLLTARLFSGE